MLLTVVATVFATLALCGTAFNLAAAALAPRDGPARVGGEAWPAVTVLRPLHGAEPELAANLRTAFTQQYPATVQIVAGTRHVDDAARRTIVQVAADYPGIASAAIVDERRHGANNKLSNLINLIDSARHPLIVLADSDVAWPRDTLARLAAALAVPGVGVASCLHVGRGDAGFWSRLAAMDISYRYMPSVIVGAATRLAQPTLGPTLALSRATLDAIGGLAAFKDVLADDYEIGRAVRATGLRTVLPGFYVTHACCEASLGALIAHELRWTVTIYRINPAGFAGSFVTHSFVLALLGAGVAGFAAPSLLVVGLSLAARVVLKMRMDAVSGVVSGAGWLLPLRDLLSFAIFCATFFVHHVDWRGSHFRVSRDGRLHGRA